MEELIQYDIVQFPSQGIFYPDLRKFVRVSYLNATDENILAATNLIENNQIVDELLKRKIIDKDFDTTLMPQEDKQAVLIFLRNTAFGSEYKVTVWDNEKQEEFESTVDLSIIKHKPFNLTGDKNGEYSMELPKSKAKIKFKFLSPAQEETIRNLDKIYEGVYSYPPTVTKTLELMIKEVEGERDLIKIAQFIETLPIVDSQYFRKFIKENRPGLDLTFTVKTPSGREEQVSVTFGSEFFRPFYGL